MMKGISQTLALIVAATVLLMAAVTLMFITSSSLGDFGQGAQSERCAQAMNLKCQGGGKVSLPESCVSDETIVESYPSSQYEKSSGDSATPGQQIDCGGDATSGSEEVSEESSGPGSCEEDEEWIGSIEDGYCTDT